MTNREKILTTSPYDYLCELNRNLRRSTDKGICIGRALLINKCLADNCNECLRLWMDKEYRNGTTRLT